MNEKTIYKLEHGIWFISTNSLRNDAFEMRVFEHVNDDLTLEITTTCKNETNHINKCKHWRTIYNIIACI